MTASNLSSHASPSQRAPLEANVDSASRFTQRSATMRRLLDDELIGVSDDELAQMVSGGGQKADRAALILASRFQGLLVRAATNICSQLSHLGIQGLCKQARCEEAFDSVYASILRQALGRDIRKDNHLGEVLIDDGEFSGGSIRQSACLRWLSRPDTKRNIPLAGWIGRELKQKGRAEDARRQWNKDRHLLQRMVLPHTVEEALLGRIADIRQIAQGMGKPDPFHILGLENDDKALRRIADRLYIDACDCWFSDEGIGISRVARYIGIIENRDELTEDITSVINLIDLMLLRASDDEAEHHKRSPDKHFYERYFNAARRLTRTINRSTIDESRIVDDEANDAFLKIEEQ